jgi:hypothetical protein
MVLWQRFSVKSNTACSPAKSFALVLLLLSTFANDFEPLARLTGASKLLTCITYRSMTLFPLEKSNLLTCSSPGT